MSKEEKTWPPPVDHDAHLLMAAENENRRRIRIQIRGYRRATQALLFFAIPIFAIGIALEGMGAASHKAALVGLALGELYFARTLRQLAKAERQLSVIQSAQPGEKCDGQ